MTFGQAIVSGFKKYADGTGRSSRSEYWYWILFTFGVSFVLSLVEQIFGGPKVGVGVYAHLAYLEHSSLKLTHSHRGGSSWRIPLG